MCKKLTLSGCPPPPPRILPYVYVHISSSDHSLLTLILPFKVILMKSEGVFWCLEWERCTLKKHFWKFIQIHRHYTMALRLKEKLPQAFMQIGWMEDEFRNLTANVWANLDNPIKRYDFSKVSLMSCMSPSQVHSFNICDVTTVQLSNGSVHNFFLQNFTFHENVSSLFFYT